MLQSTGAAVPETRAPAVGFEMDVLVGRILQSGVLLSMVLIVVGLAWHRFSTGVLTFSYPISDMNFFQFVLTTTRQVAAGTLMPRLLVNLGIMVLMLTPYVRVLASMLFFAFVERNRKYTLFTSFVFAVLTYSLLLR